jgi:hypothetical protein
MFYRFLGISDPPFMQNDILQLGPTSMTADPGQREDFSVGASMSWQIRPELES